MALARFSGSSDLKIPEPTKTASAPKLHHERGVGGSSDSARGEIRHRQFSVLATPRTSSSGAPSSFATCMNSSSRSVVRRRIFRRNRAHVADGFDDIARAGFALGADHRRAFGNAPQRFAQIARAADERAP